MRTRTELKNHLLDEFRTAPSDQVTDPKAAIIRQLAIHNAQLAVLIEIMLDFRDIFTTDPELREAIQAELRK